MPIPAYLGSGIAALLIVEALTNAVLRRRLDELRDTLQGADCCARLRRPRRCGKD